MRKHKWIRCVAACLAVVILIGSVAAATLNYDLNGDGKTNIWDLQMALNNSASEDDQKAAMKEALGGGDELHKNEEGHWEIWTSLGLYNMAKNAQSGDTFVLMQDIDMEGALWTPVSNFNGTFVGNYEHSVSNMKITQSVDGNMGFFADIEEGGVVSGLNLDGVNMIADDDTTSIGLVAGYCAGTVDACTAIGFLTDVRTTLPKNLKVGGLVGTMAQTGEILTNVENMLPAEGREDEVGSVSAKFGLRAAEGNAEAYSDLIGIVGNSGVGTVAGSASLEFLPTMADPNAIAWVLNDDTYTYPLDLDSILSAVDADGNTVVTLQADLSHDSAIKVPYSSTWDLNGYTVRTNPESGYGFHFAEAGTENKVSTVLNGSIHHYGVGIRVSAGGVVVRNVKLYGCYAPSVAIYDTSADYNDINLIENCEFYNTRYALFAFNASSSDFSNVNMTIQSSKLVTTYVDSSGNAPALFLAPSGSTGGTVTLGYDVDMYTYGTLLTKSGTTLDGVDPVLLEDTSDITFGGVTYEGMNHYTTDETKLATEKIAEVTNEGVTVDICSTKALVDAISSTGNTQIKLTNDISVTTQLNLPYSCTLDLNNFSITSNSGNAVYISGVGSDNTVAYIKNGTLNHGSFGIRVNAGAINLYNVDINGIGSCGASIAFYDPDESGAYRQSNCIDSCQFYNPNSYCIRYNVANTDFSNTGVLVKNSTLIATNKYVFSTPTTFLSGVVELGENVDIYSGMSVVCNNYFRFCGEIAYLTDQTAVTVGDTTVTDVNHWSTENVCETVNILLLGNSLSTTVPQELYRIAEANGIKLTVTDLYHAGAYGWQHVKWMTNDSEEYEYRVYNDMGLWMHGDIKTVSGAVAWRDWDHVSYQEFFSTRSGVWQEFTAESAITTYADSIEYIFDYFKSEIPDAELYFYQHWAFQIGHEIVPDQAAQTAQFEAIKEASRYFADLHSAALIPCGEAWQAARADTSIGDTLCNDDNIHANAASGGQYITGCVFYEVMFKDSCVGNTWTGSNVSDTAKYPLLQQYSHNAVAAVHGEDYAQ